MNNIFEKAYKNGTNHNKLITKASRYITNKYVGELPDSPLSIESREDIRWCAATDMMTGALLMKPRYIGIGVVIGVTLSASIYAGYKIIKSKQKIQNI